MVEKGATAVNSSLPNHLHIETEYSLTVVNAKLPGTTKVICFNLFRIKPTEKRRYKSFVTHDYFPSVAVDQFDFCVSFWK